MTIINMPLDLTDAAADNDGIVWKQIIPLDKEIVYGGNKLKFTREILDRIKSSYDNGVLQQTAFQLVDDQNRHDTEADVAANRNFDPQRYRGDVSAVTVDERGLRAGFKLTDEGLDLIKKNPKLGVSASIKPNYVDEQGKTHDFVLRHVVGTLDPKIKHMSPWEMKGVNLSSDDDPNEEVFDLTTTEPTADQISVNKADYERMQSELAELENGEALLDQILSEVADDNDVTPKATEPEKVNLSQDPEIIALKNRAAASDWRAEKSEMLREGVPASMLNLCDGVMSVWESPTINLSDGQPADTRDVLRQVLNQAKGYIDLSDENGHGSVVDSDEQKADDEYADGFINHFNLGLF